ncbi:MAG: M48 family metallopeptidase [Nanoarchaeota archaeon]|nr:M48 family metallopeptidase [Nanoarchaeota archaeon]
MVEKLSFEDQISRNKMKSFFLMAIIFVFFLIIGYIVSIILNPSYFFIIMILSIVISLIYIWAGYYNSDKIALASVKAKPASHTEHRMLYHTVENMALASGLPVPRAYVMESQEINAFASGRDPQHAVICVTTGALSKLNKEELEGVIAHEMAHIANFDIRFMTLTAVLVGMIAIAAEVFLRSLWFANTDRDSRANIILIVLGILFAILAPILAQLVSLAISRRREYVADATGAKFTRYPRGLANALRKIKAEHVPYADTKKYPKAVAPLFISDPFKKKVQNLFSTHPPVDERIRRLDAM